MDGLNLRLLGDFWIPTAPLSEQTLITDRIRAIDQGTRRLVGALEQQGNLLREYRQALISAAVTGQIDVRETRTPS